MDQSASNRSFTSGAVPPSATASSAMEDVPSIHPVSNSSIPPFEPEFDLENEQHESEGEQEEEDDEVDLFNVLMPALSLSSSNGLQQRLRVDDTLPSSASSQIRELFSSLESSSAEAIDEEDEDEDEVESEGEKIGSDWHINQEAEEVALWTRLRPLEAILFAMKQCNVLMSIEEICEIGTRYRHNGLNTAEAYKQIIASTLESMAGILFSKVLTKRFGGEIKWKRLDVINDPTTRIPLRIPSEGGAVKLPVMHEPPRRSNNNSGSSSSSPPAAAPSRLLEWKPFKVTVPQVADPTGLPLSFTIRVPSPLPYGRMVGAVKAAVEEQAQRNSLPLTDFGLFVCSVGREAKRVPIYEFIGEFSDDVRLELRHK